MKIRLYQKLPLLTPVFSYLTVLKSFDDSPSSQMTRSCATPSFQIS